MQRAVFGLVVGFGHRERRQQREAIVVDGRAEVWQSQPGVRPHGNEEQGLRGGVVAELDEQIGLEGLAAPLAAGKGLEDAIKPLGGQGDQRLGPGLGGDRVTPLVPLSPVAGPSAWQVDARAGIAVTVEVDEAALGNVIAEGLSGPVDATGGKLRHAHHHGRFAMRSQLAARGGGARLTLARSPVTPSSAMTAQGFLGLRSTHNPQRWVLPVERGICVRFGGFLFGGCGLGAAVAALEAVTGRQLVWATAQYLSYARPPEVLDLDVTVPVTGKHSSQARAIGRVGEREIFTVNAALGRRPLEVDGVWARRPAVPPPAACPLAPRMEGSDGTIHSRVELRVARGRYGGSEDGTPSDDGRSALWVRVREGLETSAAALAIIADWMPSGISHALGRWAGGNSLDNTIRIVDIVPSPWILCDIRILAIRHGFGHGSIHLWSEEGRLLATGSQSFIVRLLDEPGASGR